MGRSDLIGVGLRCHHARLLFESFLAKATDDEHTEAGDRGVGDAVVDVEAIAATGDKAFFCHEAQVFTDVGLLVA